jgi:hypothetical protein
MGRAELNFADVAYLTEINGPILGKTQSAKPPVQKLGDSAALFPAKQKKEPGGMPAGLLQIPDSVKGV